MGKSTLIINSSLNGCGSTIFNAFRNEMYEILEDKVYMCRGNKILYDLEIAILIPLVICNTNEKLYWIKSGVIKPKRLSGKLIPAYKRLPDLQFDHKNGSPGASITRYVRYNTI